MARDEKDRRKDKDRRYPVPPGGPSLLAAQPPKTVTPPPRHVYRWDLDKTYLKTEFDTLKQLVRSALEGAEAKQSVPGASALLRELRAGGGARICFISGSPRQMRRVLTKKLKLDGVEFDEFILKPNLRNMLTGRFRAMREQVGYKLPALLAGRAGLPPETRETCFGDDAEADGFIYSLYGDIIAGRVKRRLLEEILERAGTYEDDAQRAVTLAEALPTGEAVSRIFIHLDRRSPTARFDRYGARLVPVFNYFQAAMVMFEDAQLSSPAVVRVALEMVDRYGYTIDALRNSLQDLLRRGRLRRSTARTLAEELTDEKIPSLGALPSARELLISFAARVRQLGDVPSLAMPLEAPIDYLAALEADLPRKGKKRTDIAPPLT
ncbi:MAG TPA: phosphatase domain-containing protein [Polyangia bacterium]|nr:phosphatase domain-containing protein [Polyangia bacterium]